VIVIAGTLFITDINGGVSNDQLTLTVNGGYGNDNGGAAGGGGGRIAMRLTTGPNTQFGALTIQAYGGPDKSYNELDEPGAAGTIYLKGANQSLVAMPIKSVRRFLSRFIKK
jgi:hypothetical protein